uniref:Uncharacterized protein n=1 Tax=Caenorhabditis japonica TaxID=281687 RepID=A0A8R1DW32_CAEJA
MSELQVSYDAGCTQELIEDAVRNAVPQFVFCSNIISKHRIEPDDIVVLADHKMATFWYAHVSMTTANFHHFFHLNIGDYLVSFPPHTEPTYFHIYHSHVFSVSKIQAAGIPIMLPDNVVPNPNESDVDAYMRIYSPNGRLVGENIGVHHHYKNNILDKMSEPILDLAYRAMNQLRCVEVLRPTNAGGLQLTAAIVTGTSHDFLRLKIAGEERHIFLHYK